jgi:hypothetical protein
MYGLPCYSMFTIDRSSWISFRNGNRTGDQPYRKLVEFHAMPISHPYCKQ